MSNQVNHKKIEKFLRFQIQRFTYTLEVVERERERLEKQNYKDIRTVYAPMEYIEDIVTLDCDQNCITVSFCFGDIENSPVDGYSLSQIDEFIIFLRNKLSHNHLRLDNLMDKVKKAKKQQSE